MPTIRTATEQDQAGIFELIQRVYDEFDYVADATKGERDLVNLQATYFNPGGSFWILVSEARVIGTHAALPTETPSVCTFRRLYLDSTHRGGQAGNQLMQVAIDWARDEKYQRIEFWSDLKFHRAHRFFDRFGFVRTDETRSLHDGVQPYQEAFYYLEL